ncbi:double-strand break repair helicase AddA, partial [Methylobacterium sp. WL6]
MDVFLLGAAQAEAGADAPSLAGFLARYCAGGRGEAGHTVKRDMESGRDEVRVMTVHGAKGLEAPVVVMIDGCEAPGGNDPPLLAMPGDVPPVWSSAKPYDSEAIGAARESLHARAREEHNRLLYVAMTRAADRLVVAPFRGQTLVGPTAWCEMIRTGMVQAFGEGEAVETAYGPAILWRDGSGPETGTAPAEAAPEPGALPSWLREPVAAE